MNRFTVLHGRRSLQVATNRLVIPADEIGSFATSIECAQALTSLLEHERARVTAAMEQARQSGLEAGRREGQREASERMTEAVARMVSEQHAQTQATRAAVGTLALAVVNKLAATLGAEQLVPALIEQAVVELLPQRPTRVRVSPEAVEATRERVGRLGLSADVRADETLQPFDCVIDSVNGQHVVSLDTQLAAIARALGVSETVDIEVS
ncbi:hypothetical protein [Rhizobacter sp. LjRoot28]|jgi:type III secretion protein L|uniref:FliH/SctL family protein n=1 Tax=Rhizobacter sp. LjRoot28 TaxID=3342309 RepID=UPI003ECF98FE